MKPTAADTSKMPKKKKPYTRPFLTCYGKFKDLVQGAGGNKSDGGGQPRSRACWVAEVLYGIDDPRTHLVRAWLPRAAAKQVGWRLFLAIYTAVGQQAAALIERSHILRACATPLFDGLVARASREAPAIVRTALTLRSTR